MTDKKPLLQVNNLKISVWKDGRELYPVNEVDLDISESAVVGLVGESGCGKSMTARALIGLPGRGAKVTGGSVMLGGLDLVDCPAEIIQEVAGNRISMIFQDPMTSLNPTIRVGKQIEEVLLLHTDLGKSERKARVIEMMQQVGIPDAEARYKAFPHQLSGGLRQRIVIAMAMICKPELLIADEPTTALDVTIENQILRLMKRLQKESGMAVLLISHNLGVISAICDEVHVMYLGEIVETAPTGELLNKPMHPYTTGILECLPGIAGQHGMLARIPGAVPSLDNVPEGCRFAGRCPKSFSRCMTEHPELRELESGHFVRCHLYDDRERV